MRQIGMLPDEDQARTFADYALTRGVKMQVEPEDGRWVVWVYEEDQVEQARQELESFSENPDDPLYHQAARAAGRLRREQEKRLEQLRKRHVDVRSHWNQPWATRCRVTFFLMMISIAVALGTRLGEQHDPLIDALSIASYERDGQMIQFRRGLQDIRNGEVWRLVTPIFIHFGFLHILFNMYMLYHLGSAVETARRSRRYLALVLFVAISSNVAQYWWSDHPAFGGMSGVVYGLFGYLWMKSKFDPQAGFFVPPTMVFILIGWMLLGMVGAIPGAKMANAAHFVGLVAGMIVGYAPVWWRNFQRR